ncbi:MAG: hypothetical protein AAGH74_10780 [Pseudomonadota bacterium]
MPEIVDAIFQNEFAEVYSIQNRIVLAYDRVNEDYSSDAFPGWRIEETRASSGAIERREVYDDTGVLRQSLIVDLNGTGPDGLGFEPWSFQMEFYDAAGELELFVQFDDDFSNTAIFYEEDGIHRIEANDGIVRQFDGNGQLEAIIRVLDDGRSRTKIFDETGTIDARITTDPYTPGPIFNFGNGEPITPEPEIKGNYKWFMNIDDFHDSGVRSERTTIFDNFDFRTVLFDENGQRTEKQLIDYDGDKPWVAKRVLYDDQGNVTERIKYFEDEGVPDDFQVSSLYADLKEAGVVDPYTDPEAQATVTDFLF